MLSDRVLEAPELGQLVPGHDVRLCMYIYIYIVFVYIFISICMNVYIHIYAC